MTPGGRSAAGLLAAAILVVAGATARAQDLEPRAYTNTPVGLNFLVAGYGYSEGGVATDASLPLENTRVQLHGAVLAYARAIDLWGRSGKIDVILPYAWVHGTADVAGQPHVRDVDGFGDPRFRLSVNLWGAPALTLEEFERWEQDLIVGASVQVAPPLGQYESGKLLNIGTNRWTVKPELGISKALGRFILELIPSGVFYGDNDDFLGHSRAQDPVFSIQGHVIYAFRWGLWGAIDATYYTGGQARVDGRRSGESLDNTRVGGTLALPLGRHYSIKLYASTGASARAGSDFDSAGIAFQYRWGAGL